MNGIGMAVASDRVESAEWLLQHGADPDLKYREVKAPAIYRARSVEMIRLLVRYGADVNGCDINGCTALFNLYPSVLVEEILKHGLDPNLATHNGTTAFDGALPDRILLLLKYGGVSNHPYPQEYIQMIASIIRLPLPTDLQREVKQMLY
jgi:hypothetical protein